MSKTGGLPLRKEQDTPPYNTVLNKTPINNKSKALI